MEGVRFFLAEEQGLKAWSFPANRELFALWIRFICLTNQRYCNYDSSHWLLVISRNMTND